MIGGRGELLGTAQSLTGAKVGKSQRSPAFHQKAGGVNVFRVESAEPYGWIVYLDGFAKTHFFISRSLALTYARDWAKVNAPSLIVVVGADGKVERYQTVTSRVPRRAL
jgi:hypothetical protein